MASQKTKTFSARTRRALDTARRTGTPCYVMQDGKLVDIARAGRIPRRAASR